MSVLALERVSKRVRSGAHERVLLCDASLRLHAGELVAVWSVRDGGRCTMLRIAAGIEPLDSGVVSFAGKPLRGHAGELLGRGIGYCRAQLHSQEARAVLDELLVGQLARGVPRRLAQRRALEALERTGATGCAASELSELDGAEAVRASIARALVLAPKLLVVEDPTRGVDLLARDEILALLRSLADDGGLAVLISVGEATALAGADRALSLSNGVLRGSAAPPLAPVLELRRRAGSAAGAGA